MEGRVCKPKTNRQLCKVCRCELATEMWSPTNVPLRSNKSPGYCVTCWEREVRGNSLVVFTGPGDEFEYHIVAQF